MRTSVDDFQGYLAPDEPLIHRMPGALVEGSHQTTGSIGLTDRRVLFISEDDTFRDFAFHGISSIESRSRTPDRYSKAGYLKMAVGFGLLAAMAALVGFAFLSTGFAFVLVLLTLLVLLGSVTGAEYVRRHEKGHELDGIGQAKEFLLTRRDDVGVLSQFDGTVNHQSVREWTSERNGILLILGLVAVGIIALASLVVVTGSLLVLPLCLMFIGGIALSEHSYQQLQDVDSVNQERKTMRDVRVHLFDGRVVRLRVDSVENLDQDLSTLLYMESSQQNTLMEANDKFS